MHRRRIALVDDDTIFLELIEEVLTDEGYEVITWEEGRTAHNMIRRERPDLVIMDLFLDDWVGGRDILSAMEHDPATREIPVILCSGLWLEQSQEAQSLLRQGVSFIPKPFDLDDLLTKIRESLDGRSKSDLN